ncbi:MAG: RNA pseudouridine synthase [Rhodothermaeota bacterium MED-G18]|nr:MAG: RNA pseudouridine synthase [Rhodothermaeota bacterium MED-G18]|tara:strand:- start:3426 stop:4430 length:1005 start_codon:yes stop_codon:yes gene_type:complete
MAREKEVVMFVVDRNQDLIRIDKFLFDKMPNVTRNKIKDGIKSGKVLVNKGPIKPSYKVKPLDKVEASLDREKRADEIKPENIELDILHEDEDILIVNKKAGMVVHPAHENWDGTLVNALIYHLKGLPEMRGNEGRPGLVHRIDKDTSGLLVIAKNEKSMASLADQFFNHTIKRKYQAIVWGVPENNEGTIDVNLRRSIKDRRVVEGFANNTLGKKAITHYKLIEKVHYISLIECELETGRTHQIRAHMKHIGHPIFCDKVYGGKLIVKGNRFTNYKRFVENSFRIIERQALHAKSLGFIHPSTNKEVYFESKLPEDMSLLLDKWRKYEVPKSY